MGSSKKERQENERYSRWLAEQERQAERQANAFAYLQMRTHDSGLDGRALVKVTARVRFDDDEGVLVILNTDGEHGPEVAFQSGEELLGTLAAVANRWSNGQLKWREDSDGWRSKDK